MSKAQFLGWDPQCNMKDKTSTHIMNIFKNMFTDINDEKLFVAEE